MSTKWSKCVLTSSSLNFKLFCHYLHFLGPIHWYHLVDSCTMTKPKCEKGKKLEKTLNEFLDQTPVETVEQTAEVGRLTQALSISFWQYRI